MKILACYRMTRWHVLLSTNDALYDTGLVAIFVVKFATSGT